jgi:hypothetical protein
MSPTQEMRIGPEGEIEALACGWADIADGSAGFGGFSEGRSWVRAAKQKFSARRIEMKNIEIQRAKCEQTSARDGMKRATRKNNRLIGGGR